MPQLGETVAEGTVSRWFKRPGDAVVKGELLFEVSTDKVDTEIPSQATGVLSAILVEEGQTVDVGTVLAVITSDADTASPAPSSASEPQVAPPVARDEVAPSVPAAERTAQLSPVVRRLLAEHGLTAEEVAGTGPNGRVTRDDVLRHVASRPPESVASTTQSPVVRKLLAEHGLDASSIVASNPNGRLTRRDVEEHIVTRSSAAPASLGAEDVVVPFTRIRRLTAEHMVRSKATSAHTLMVREVDYEAVERVRRREGPGFKEREGFSLTYLPFNATATLLALHDFPHLNASVGDNELLVHRAINLGIAVDLNNEGLVVPVVFHADGLGLRGLARAINEKATRARGGTLGIDDFAGGTFTITNPGPFGTLLTGAVINQPQVAILSTDGVSRRPVVVAGENGEESIAIHSMGLLALTFDHRAVDGAYAARFLQRMAEILRDHDWAAAL
jgi:2-oxoglutarate dehydrogenase E2 component (dihydrolipoamide succinyltransferase)